MTQFAPRALPEHLAKRMAAKRRAWGVQGFCLGLAILCLLGAGMLVGPINDVRRERQLVVDPQSIAGLPPHISLLGKLGTFRALVIDWAAIRAERLKEEGKTYEALELHKTVCKLAPRFAKMWANAAWNMAYNISVMQYTPEARWQWVNNGIKILRDEGIPYNPKSATLYKELTWIYWHKICGYLDDHHLDYKRALAVEMETVLGPPPVAVSTDDYFAWFRAIVDAPREFDALIESDPEVAALVSRLDAADLKPDRTLLEFVARHIRPELTLKSVLADDAVPTSPEETRIALLTDENHAETLDRLLAALRSHVLRKEYHLDIDRMLSLMVDKFGPLDWRNGFVHGLYWSTLGDEVGGEHEATDISDKMNNARLIFFALQSLVTRGNIVLWPDFDDPFQSHMAMTPDTRLIPYLFDTYLELGKKHFGDHPMFRENTPGPNYMNGFVTNIHTWIELLYLEGGEKNMELAREYFAYLREFNPHPNGGTQERYLQPIEGFITEGIRDRLLTYTAINGILRNFIDRGLKYYANGDPTAAVRSIARARLVYTQWMKDTRVDINDRRKLQPLNVIVDDQIETFMRDEKYRPLAKVQLWRALPLSRRQSVNDWLQPYFAKLCESQEPRWAAEKAFPVPPGMEQARQENRVYRGKKRTDIEQGEKILNP